jgi:hypothetical protein
LVAGDLVGAGPGSLFVVKRIAGTRDKGHARGNKKATSFHNLFVRLNWFNAALPPPFPRHEYRQKQLAAQSTK